MAALGNFGTMDLTLAMVGSGRGRTLRWRIVLSSNANDSFPSGNVLNNQAISAVS
jgi:hypothetical protein